MKLLRTGQLVPYYLMASYLYYLHEISIMEDTEYDRLCIRLDKNWSKVEHPHKKLVDRKALTAGTGFYLKEHDYPLMVRRAAWQYAYERHLTDKVPEHSFFAKKAKPVLKLKGKPVLKLKSKLRLK